MASFVFRGLFFFFLICFVVTLQDFISKVHVVFSNHVDVGFNRGEILSNRNPCNNGPYTADCGYAFSVINVYFDDFLPQAALIANQLKQQGIDWIYTLEGVKNQNSFLLTGIICF